MSRVLSGVPPAAALLGFAGLIPFYATGIGVWLVEDLRWAGWLFFMQIAYGACIASFMGAVHWGLAMANLGWEAQRTPQPQRLNDGGDGSPRPLAPTRQMGFSVVPALMAWGALVWGSLVPGAHLPTLLLLMVTFVVALAADRRAVRYALAPLWYLDLRIPLTMLVEVALLLSLVRLLTVPAA
ncbi:MAG: DUF3429 domain-containing protein [Inquilinaceae bacterium]